MRKMSFLFIFLLTACGQNASDTTELNFADLSSSAADHILINGNILTVDADFSMAQAIAISGVSILSVGSNEEINALTGPNTLITDLQGRTVVPGLIDNHNHFVRATEQWYRQVRWDDVYTRAEALAMLQEKAASLPEGEWVVVLGGWIFEQFSDGQNEFSRSELDLVLPENPLYIQLGYGRAYANSLALSQVGFDENTSIPGVQIENGQLTGVLLGANAFLSVASQIPATSDDKWDESLQMAVEDYLKQGLTTLLDIGGNTVTPRHYDAVARAAQNNTLDMRVFYTLNNTNGVGPGADDIIEALNANPPRSGNDQFGQFTYGEMTYEGIRDPNGSTAALPESEFDNYQAILETAANRGWQIHEHSTRDDKMQALLERVELVNQTTDITDMRWTLAHAEGASDETIARARDLGMLFALHSSGGLGAVARAANGQDVSRIPPIRQINDAGAIWGLGSDGTVVSGHHPFQNIGWAVSGLAKNGQKLLLSTVSREDALRAHTLSNAYMMFMEDKIGSLETGKYADLVVLDRNFMTVPEAEIKDIKAVMTMVNGEVVFTQE